MADALLEARALLLLRTAAVDALKAVDFSVQAGEIHALIGPNGAGKTTFIHHVSGALPPTRQRAFSGRDVIPVGACTNVGRPAWPVPLDHQCLLRLAGARQRGVGREAGPMPAEVSFLVAGARRNRPVRRRTQLSRPGWPCCKTGAVAGQLSHGEQRALELAYGTGPPDRNCCSSTSQWPAPAPRSRHAWSN